MIYTAVAMAIFGALGNILMEVIEQRKLQNSSQKIIETGYKGGCIPRWKPKKTSKKAS